MVPTGSGTGAGLLEKRLGVFSWLGLSDGVTLIGDYNHSIQDPISLGSDATPHLNHASDPAAHTMAVTDVASFSMVRDRPLTDTLVFDDYAHATLEGYHPPGGGGGGDPDLSLHSVTANETVLVGQPIYISGNNTINLASATDTTTAQSVGLVVIGATAGSTANILTEGSVNQADWTNVIGTTLLTPGSVYFLSTSAGQMVTAPPTGDGETVVTMGTAITTTKFDIEVNEIAIL